MIILKMWELQNGVKSHVYCKISWLKSNNKPKTQIKIMWKEKRKNRIAVRERIHHSMGHLSNYKSKEESLHLIRQKRRGLKTTQMTFWMILFSLMKKIMILKMPSNIKRKKKCLWIEAQMMSLLKTSKLNIENYRNNQKCWAIAKHMNSLAVTTWLWDRITMMANHRNLQVILHLKQTTSWPICW